MRTKHFWLSAAERCGKTFCQSLIATWMVGNVVLDLRAVDWATSLSVAGGAALLSLLFSVISAPIGPDGSPSLVGEPPKQPVAVLETDEPTSSGRHVLDDDPDDVPVCNYMTENEIARRADRKI